MSKAIFRGPQAFSLDKGENWNYSSQALVMVMTPATIEQLVGRYDQFRKHTKELVATFTFQSTKANGQLRPLRVNGQR